MLGKLDTRRSVGPWVVTVFDRDRVADYQKLVAQCATQTLRAELISAIPESGQPAQICRPAQFAVRIIQGSDEKAPAKFQIKDLIEGAKAAAADRVQTRNGARTRPAQFSCARGDRREKCAK